MIIRFVERLLKKIEYARNYMNYLIEQKGNLHDPEVILASQVLDAILNEYYELYNKKMDNH